MSRRWNHLVRKPLPVSDYAFHSTDNRAFLQSIGITSELVDKIFEVFAHDAPRANTWSRALGDTPEPRVDALELYTGLALTCRDTLKDRLFMLFSLFNTGGTGVLVEDDLGALISSCGSFLRRLRLALPISSDEAAFVAGGAIATMMDQSGSHKTRCAFEIDRWKFMEWARRSELVVHVMELLALPHRLSRTVDMVSIKMLPLRERYSNARKIEEEKTNRRARGHVSLGKSVLDTSRNMWLSEERVGTVLREHGTNGRDPSFKLPPVLSGIGSHDVNVVLEADSGTTNTANGSAWHVVATIESRTGSSFSVTDTQSLLLHGGAPAALRFSGLRAGTDHRLHFVWNVFGYTHRRVGQEEAKRVCRTLRFRTLPSRSSTTSRDPNASRGISVGRCHTPDQIRCGVTVVRTYYEAGGDSPSDAIAPPMDEVDDKTEDSTPADRNVAVIISHRRLTSLEAGCEQQRGGPWWDSARRDVYEGGQHQYRGGVKSPCNTLSAQAAEQDISSTAPGALNAAPSCTEEIEEAIAVADTNQPWSAGGVGVGDIDITVHLNPNWQAPGVVRRCFCMLEECHFEMPAVREDARRHVSREVFTAVRSLLSKSSQSQQRALRDSGIRHGAHIVLGDVQPWLGLEEVRNFVFSGEQIYCQ